MKIPLPTIRWGRWRRPSCATCGSKGDLPAVEGDSGGGCSHRSTDKLDINSVMAIAELQKNDNQSIINSTIMIAEMQNNKPMGVATYRTSDEKPKALRKAMPGIEALKRLL